MIHKCWVPPFFYCQPENRQFSQTLEPKENQNYSWLHHQITGDNVDPQKGPWTLQGSRDSDSSPLPWCPLPSVLTEAQLKAFFPVPPAFLEFEFKNQYNLGVSCTIWPGEELVERVYQGISQKRRSGQADGKQPGEGNCLRLMVTYGRWAHLWGTWVPGALFPTLQ